MKKYKEQVSEKLKEDVKEAAIVNSARIIDNGLQAQIKSIEGDILDQKMKVENAESDYENAKLSITFSTEQFKNGYLPTIDAAYNNLQTQKHALESLEALLTHRKELLKEFKGTASKK